jgi:hypothetical protein
MSISPYPQAKTRLTYPFEGQEIDSIDLKMLLVSRGIRVSNEIYKRYQNKARLTKNPLECNTFRLPDGIYVQLTDLSFHMEYIRTVITWDMIKQVKYLPELRTDFNLKLDENDTPAIYHKKQKVTTIEFLEPTDFYHQKTSSGMPFLGNAVLQGNDWVSFPLLWRCDFGMINEPCQYCFPAGEIASMSPEKKRHLRYPTPEDVAEMVEYAIIQEKCATSVQITGGSLFNDRAEVDIIKNILRAIDERVGMENIPGEVVVYITPTKKPETVDEIFAAGADRVSASFEIWNEELAAKIMPAKMRITGRQRHADCLNYIASTYGKNKACSNFIIGLEPLESVLEGAEYCASRGIVPIASTWIPFGRPVEDSMRGPELSYYQAFKTGLARIYDQYDIVPPGARGLNVCVDRDIYRTFNQESLA